MAVTQKDLNDKKDWLSARRLAASCLPCCGRTPLVMPFELEWLIECQVCRTQATELFYWNAEQRKRKGSPCET